MLRLFREPRGRASNPVQGLVRKLLLEEVKCKLCGFCSVFHVSRHILFVVCFESCFQNEEARGKGDVSRAETVGADSAAEAAWRLGD